MLSLGILFAQDSKLATDKKNKNNVECLYVTKEEYSKKKKKA